MNIQLRSDPTALTAGWEETVKRRVDRMLVRYRHHLQGVSIQLSQISGPNGTMGKACRIVIRLDDDRLAVGQASDADLSRAIGLAVVRARLAAARRLHRRLRVGKQTVADRSPVAGDTLVRSAAGTLGGHP